MKIISQLQAHFFPEKKSNDLKVGSIVTARIVKVESPIVARINVYGKEFVAQFKEGVGNQRQVLMKVTEFKDGQYQFKRMSQVEQQVEIGQLAGKILLKSTNGIIPHIHLTNISSLYNLNLQFLKNSGRNIQILKFKEIIDSKKFSAKEIRLLAAGLFIPMWQVGGKENLLNDTDFFELLRRLTKQDQGKEILDSIFSNTSLDNRIIAGSLPIAVDDSETDSVQIILTEKSILLNLMFTSLGELEIIVKRFDSFFQVDFFSNNKTVSDFLEENAGDLKGKLGLPVQFSFYERDELIKKIIEINSFTMSNNYLDTRV